MRGNWRIAVIPVLMVVVAIAHGVRVRAFDENPWVGAGFGMFAEIDGPQRAIEVTNPAGGVVVFPANLDGTLARAASFPTSGELRRLADALERTGVEITRLRVLRPVYTSPQLTWEEVASLDNP
ncbi:MAG: hypothetical protein WD269_06060 [Acidimicrobiia bacterium]